MNAQHRINKSQNRKRRLPRLILEAKAHKISEIITAQKQNREPVLAGILSRLSRLENRLRELENA